MEWSRGTQKTAKGRDGVEYRSQRCIWPGLFAGSHSHSPSVTATLNTATTSTTGHACTRLHAIHARSPFATTISLQTSASTRHHSPHIGSGTNSISLATSQTTNSIHYGSDMEGNTVKQEKMDELEVPLNEGSVPFSAPLSSVPSNDRTIQ